MSSGGSRGAGGVAGPPGQRGLQGVAGINGSQGNTGPRGPQGVQGEKGEMGGRGLAGPQGVDGAPGQDDTAVHPSKSKKDTLERQERTGSTRKANFTVTLTLALYMPHPLIMTKISENVHDAPEFQGILAHAQTVCTRPYFSSPVRSARVFLRGKNRDWGRGYSSAYQGAYRRPPSTFR